MRDKIFELEQKLNRIGHMESNIKSMALFIESGMEYICISGKACPPEHSMFDLNFFSEKNKNIIKGIVKEEKESLKEKLKMELEKL